MKEYLKSIFALTIICAVIGLALAATNVLTALIIEINEAEAVQQSMQVVMPDGSIKKESF